MPFLSRNTVRAAATASRIAIGRRLSGPFASDLKFWLDADSLSLSDDDTVASYPSKAGNITASQSIALSRPIFKTNILNSLPIIRFDGLNDYLDVGNSISRSNDWTIIGVFSVDNTTSSGAVCGASDQFLDETTAWGTIFVNGYTDVLPYVLNTTPRNGSLAYVFGDDINVSEGETGAGILTASTFYIVAFTQTDGQAAVNIRLNGTTKAITLIGSNTATDSAGTQYDFSIGRFGKNNSKYFDGDLASLLVYDRSLSSSEISKTENYLADKYNISLA